MNTSRNRLPIWYTAWSLVAAALLWAFDTQSALGEAVSDWPLHMPESSGGQLLIPLILPARGSVHPQYLVVGPPQPALQMLSIGSSATHSSPQLTPDSVGTVMLQLSLYARFHTQHPELFEKPSRIPAGLTQTLRGLLEAGANPDEISDPAQQHQSALGILVCLPKFDGDTQIEQLLLDHRATLDATASFDSPVETAVACGRDDLLTPLLATRRVSPDTLTRALQKTVAQKKYPTAVQLLRAGADPNQPQEDGATLLATPPTSDQEFIDALLTHGAKVDFPQSEADRYRQFQVRLDPVVWSILHQRDYLASRLIQRDGMDGIDAHAAVVYAASEGSVLTLTELLSRGADPNSASTRGISALMAAAFHRREPALQLLLLQPDIRVNATSKTLVNDLAEVVVHGGHQSDHIGKRTALMYAASMSDIEGINMLLAHDARRDLKDAEGLTALDYARSPEACAALGGSCTRLRTSLPLNTSH